MATLTQTTDLARFFYGAESVYTGASTTDKATFDKGIYICTDTGRLYMHGVEVRDTNALTWDATDHKLVATLADGTTKVDIVTLPDVESLTGTADDQAKYGVISGATYKSLTTSISNAASAASKAKDAAETAQTTADNAASAAATAQSGVDAINSAKGKASGFASLDSDGKVPSSQLPSYVDDVLEYDYKDSTEKGSATSGTTFPATGETGKIYVSKATNLTYRWGGTTYVEISPSLALGETSSTAFAGDRGKALEDAWDDFKENQLVTGISYDDSTHTLSLDVPDGSSVTLGTDTIPTASDLTDGVMTKAQVSTLDSSLKSISMATPGTETIVINETTNGNSTTAAFTLPAAVAKTSDADGSAGLLTAADKQKYDAGLTMLGTSIKQLPETATADETDVTVTPTLNNNTSGSTMTINHATTGAAGVMSAADKTNLDALVAVSVWYAAT